MESVELMQAFSWICPNCGKRNFTRAIGWEGSPEDEIRIKGELGVPFEEEGDLVSVPNKVSCVKCEMKYNTDI